MPSEVGEPRPSQPEAEPSAGALPIVSQLLKLSLAPKKNIIAEAVRGSLPKARSRARCTPGVKDRVFLIDTMSFIFRAYHAMARQRPMSTKTGLPTAAIYVFVNMLRKLREDFSPEYLAAVFDVGGKTFRDQEAESITTVRKFDLKTQSFQEIQYHGYKANRSEMPEDLVQQVPYIRRALEAYRIPILEQKGFEADDLIGTLARKAAAESYLVYVVSSDKDMLQLVTDKVLVLNPPKDNLIADAAKVEEILGVPPERVVDVMALRGDSIDNIPGAPGIGDKGSVELIKRFGSVEQALDHAAEIEKKTYRESLLNNREIVMFSKRMATIDCNVPVELDLNAMRAGEPEVATLRSLFAELEFTSLLKELLPVVEVTEAQYGEAKSAAEVEAIFKRVPSGGSLTIAIEAATAASTEEKESEENEPEEGMLLFQLAPPVESSLPVTRNIAISAHAGSASTVALNSEAGSKLKSALANDRVPKVCARLQGGAPCPQRSGHRAFRRAARHPVVLLPARSHVFFARSARGRATSPQSQAIGKSRRGRRHHRPPRHNPAQEVEQYDLKKIYDEIDLPLVPVLARMEEAGVKIDTEALARMSTRLEREIDAKAREIYDCCAHEFNINSPQQLGDVLFNRLNLPKPVKYGKGKTISTAVDVLEGLGRRTSGAAAGAGIPPALEIEIDLRRHAACAPEPVDWTLAHHLRSDRTATGRLSSANPNLQNIPIRTEVGREIRAAFTAEPGHVLLAADYSQIELRLLAHFSKRCPAGRGLQPWRRYSHPDGLAGLRRASAHGHARPPPPGQSRELRNRLRPVALSDFRSNLGIEPSEAKQFINAYFEKYSGVRAFIDKTLEEARRDQKVKTLFGRIRPIPDINSKNTNQRGFAERTAVNTPLQGTAADLIKIAMIRIDEAIRDRS